MYRIRRSCGSARSTPSLWPRKARGSCTLQLDVIGFRIVLACSGNVQHFHVFQRFVNVRVCGVCRCIFGGHPSNLTLSILGDMLCMIVIVLCCVISLGDLGGPEVVAATGAFVKTRHCWKILRL